MDSQDEYIKGRSIMQNNNKMSAKLKMKNQDRKMMTSNLDLNEIMQTKPGLPLKPIILPTQKYFTPKVNLNGKAIEAFNQI